MQSERNLEPVEGFPQIFPGILIRCENITQGQGKEYLRRINAQSTGLLMQEFIVKVFKVVVKEKSSQTSTCEYYAFIRVSWVHHGFFFFFLILEEKERIALFLCQAKEEHSRLMPQELSVQLSRSVMSDSLRPHALQRTSLPGPSSIPGAYSDSCH